MKNAYQQYNFHILPRNYGATETQLCTLKLIAARKASFD